MGRGEKFGKGGRVVLVAVHEIFLFPVLATICGFCKSTHTRRLRYEETYVAKGRSPVSHIVSKFIGLYASIKSGVMISAYHLCIFDNQSFY